MEESGQNAIVSRSGYSSRARDARHSPRQALLVAASSAQFNEANGFGNDEVVAALTLSNHQKAPHRSARGGEVWAIAGRLTSCLWPPKR